MMALLGMTDADGLLALRNDASPSVRLAAVLALRRLGNPQISRFLNDESSQVMVAAARAIHDVPIEAALPQLAAFLGKVDCPEALVSRAINANLRVGDTRNATLLATYANRRDVAEVSRVSALEALSTWEQPASVDRVMGLWRPLPHRNPEPARRALRTASPGFLSGKSEAVTRAFLRCVAALKVKEVGHAAFDFMRYSNATPVLRSETLKMLAAVHHSRWSEALRVGLEDPVPAVRAEALKLAADNPEGDIFPQVQELLDHSPLLFRFEHGHMTAREFFDAVQSEAKFRGSYEEFTAAFADIFSEMPRMVQLHAELRVQKIPTFIFSNTNELAIHHVRRNFPFFDMGQHRLLFQGDAKCMCVIVVRSP